MNNDNIPNEAVTPTETVKKGVLLEVEAIPVVNYCLQQNMFSVVKSITIHNNTEKDIENAELKITSSPSLTEPFSVNVAIVPKGMSFAVKKTDLKLSAEALVNMTEKVSGSLVTELSVEGAVVAESRTEITALAFDEWHGYSYYPELLAGFVTPNHPILARVIKRASEHLKEWTGNAAMDAYQTQDANRVLRQVAAVFHAVKEEGIAYCVPPASYETVGQRVRLSDSVLQQKLGTCLDLTLLFASVLEAVGLNSLVVITKGHAFCGVWLEEHTFPEPVQDDAAVITKRLAAGVNEIVVFETTLAADGNTADFDDARVAGERHLSGGQPVECIIDISRARAGGVLPLPQRIMTDNGWHVEAVPERPKTSASAPKEVNGLGDITVTESDVDPKITFWERKLLDLGLRNNLINLRFSKNLVPILASSLDDLEDALAGEKEFSILPKPGDSVLKADASVFEVLHDLGPMAETVKQEFENQRLRTVLTEGALATVIKSLYREAKASLEENGANTLYLALGLLKLFENERSTKPRYAPIVLIPVEIVRKSAGQGYRIRLRDDDPQMNITVLEKIKQDFGIHVNGLDPLPLDEHGVDLRMVFTVLRKAIMEQPKWDVLESAYLGIFSFSQFVMWNDMRNRTDDLLKNKVVKSLVDGKLCWEAKAMEIGSRVPEGEALLPMPADASQLYAIESACNGESFVLHGPPGTGKSQTITSLIANALARGRTVLFVAEKMAALEVVQKRLDGIGLGPFCLELHSNRSKKRDVLEQLRVAAEVTKFQSPEKFAQRAESIAALRAELDSYAEKLHRVGISGRTLQQLINDYECFKNAPDIDAFERDFVKKVSGADVDEHILLLERLAAAGKEVGHPLGHPLTEVGATEYTQQLRNDLNNKVTRYLDCLNGIAETLKSFAASVGFGAALSFSEVKKQLEVARELKYWEELPKGWAKVENIAYYASEIKDMSAHFKTAVALKQSLLEKWDESFLKENGSQLLAEYNTVSAKWFFPKALGISKLAKRLAAFSLAPVKKEDIGPSLISLSKYKSELAAASKIFDRYKADLAKVYFGEKTDWDKISAMADTAQRSAEALKKLTGNDRCRLNFNGDSETFDTIDELLNKSDAFLKAKGDCYTLLCMADRDAEFDWVDDEAAKCDKILGAADGIKEWIAFNAAAADAAKKGLGNVVKAYKNGLQHSSVVPSYRKAMTFAQCTLAIDAEASLNSFSGSVFNEKIEQYKRIDAELMKLTQQEIHCRLASKIPDFVEAAAHSSEIGILQRLIKSNGRGVSIRRMFEQLSNLLPRLCPCMLMSPMSAAQYLDPKREPFDIVIFDEASQLPTCKAVGVLARGKDAVIVGDPKQMPPTSFFATNTSKEEENAEAEDLESILDDCLAIYMPQTHLLWHYRSRHESLIAFSNNQFYENKLYTFPSVNDRESKVTWVHVDGSFDSGNTRVNRAEAEAVVEEIKRRSCDEALRSMSIGVVTFNVNQQHLIDDLLSEACAADPELEKWMLEAEEPMFIKNLENVQGDERDVILFSIGYDGIGKNGRPNMNFGPLNNDGGWRRLNVAVSRARCEMMVFSTLRPEHIDLSRTNAEGVVALKAFLSYAAGRALALDENSAGLYRHADGADGIVKTICDELKAAGYETDIAVGHSEYRIDIGVIDPKHPEKYILGILLDGDSYRSAKTTRDREVAQLTVLKGLGWKLHRVWTMDWWDNSRKELDRILDRIKNIENEVDNDPEVPAEIPDEPLKPEAPKPMTAKDEGVLVEYKTANLRERTVMPEDFVSGRYEKGIIQAVNAVMKAEAPISHKLLVKRVVQSYGIARAGSRIQEYMDKIFISLKLAATTQNGEKFYWNPDQKPSNYNIVRISPEGETKRDTDDIPLKEAYNAVHYVLTKQISLSEDDLIREAARLMGYTRKGTVVTSIFSSAIESAVRTGRIKKDRNERYVLN